MTISLMCAALRLAAPFSDGAVLQRGMPVPVWGIAEPQTTVTIAFAGQEKSAMAAADGSWRVTLDPLEASCDGRELTVVERSDGRAVPNRTVLRDVVVGEVWYVSGQSNAECPLWGDDPRYRDRNGALTAQMTDKPLVRMCFARHCHSSETPKRFPDYEVKWEKFNRVTLGSGHSFSAIGAYFALDLHAAIGVPVGVVGSYDGGTCIESWIPAEGYASVGLDPRACAPRPEAYHRPCGLWNEMVSPWTPMAMRGFLWYQGCSNSGQPELYCQRMHALYNGWAKTFENPDLRLYFVQIAPWGGGGHPEFQQAQAKFDAEEPNAGMAVINDLGNLTDIHPNEKYTVAKRLLVHALKRDYGFPDIRDNSPTLRDWRIEKGRFVLSFDDADGFYIYNQKYCSRETGFELCGADGVWKPALVANQKVTVRANGDRVYLGQIEGRELVVEAAGVPEPKRLRYLYSRPWYGSLYNEVGLPLGSFAIDAAQRGNPVPVQRTAEPRTTEDAVRLSDLRVRDPFVVNVGGERPYLLYMSDSWLDGTAGVSVSRSADLVRWSKPKNVLKAPDWCSQVWAPEIHRWKGAWYAFVTLKEKPELKRPIRTMVPGEPDWEPWPGARTNSTMHAVWIYRSESPEGPFLPVSDGPVTDPAWTSLDGTLAVEDGKPWMVFTHDWAQVRVGTYELAPLADDLSRFLAPPKTLFTAEEFPMTPGRGVTDGAYLYRSPKSGKLFMIWSTHNPARKGSCDYCVVLAESETGRIAGPWINHRLLFDENGGHGMFFRKADGTLMLCVHCPEKWGEEHPLFLPVEDDGETLRLTQRK